MNGAHDLGGWHGFGKIDRSQQPHFPQQWQRQVFALTLACGMQGRWNLDQSRAAREQMAASDYLASSYYAHWLHGLERLLRERDIVCEQELQTGKAQQAAVFQPITAELVQQILSTGSPTAMQPTQPARYQIGERVLIANQHPLVHTRMPRYIRGRCGVIVLYHGAHVFADAHALSGAKLPAHLYSVRFDAVELWGEQDAEANTEVCVDVFEPYIATVTGDDCAIAAAAAAGW